MCMSVDVVNTVLQGCGHKPAMCTLTHMPTNAGVEKEITLVRTNSKCAKFIAKMARNNS